MAQEIKDLPLGITGFHFSDLYLPDRLRDLYQAFWTFADTSNPGLKSKYSALGTGAYTKPQESEVLIETAKVTGDFLAKLFNVSTHAARLKTSTNELQPVFRFKKEFLNIRVFKRLEEAAIDASGFKEIDEKVKRLISAQPPSTKNDPELDFAETVMFLVDCEKKLKTAPLDVVEQQKVSSLCAHLTGQTIQEKISAALQLFEDWCTQIYVAPARRTTVDGWMSYRRAHKVDFENLVPTEKTESNLPEKLCGPEKTLRFRDGFKLTDNRMSAKEVLREIDYCIICHPREKDSCTTGFVEKTGGYKKNPLGIPLNGCPLDEKISEMHLLRKHGEVLGSLAMIMLDNPMCPGTGHRICNDCMKGCIYQKQEPVNIPQNETGVLTDVLNLPYGFEIYSLLTRFNPVNYRRPYALPYNGVDVLVVGLGPAGYTLSHYLANEGFGVVGIDGLKLEPVDPFLTGRGKPFPKPIQNFSELKKDLDDRILMGFGGVSEYGITVRWDKNFLSVIYLSLLRRKNLRFFGGVRFGGTLTLDDAWQLGFKHVALATGAGRPTIIDLKNNLIKGIRKASDFLMALQLTGAFKRNAMANLQVRLPAVVIGGGLTAIDTATEMLAYYPIQVEKTLERYETLLREQGEANVLSSMDEEDRETLKVFLEHGKSIRDERRLAEKERRKPNFIKLCREWGGVSVAYRKRMSDSPAYRLNHEEIIKAFEEGISFIENVSPVEAKKDRFGWIDGLVMKRANGENITIPAKTMFVAAGTSPNTIYEREFPGSFKLDAKKNFFQKHTLLKSEKGWSLKESTTGESGAFFLSHEKDQKFVTYYGDNHPDFAGNVVKAMASAKFGAPHVFKLFESEIKQAEKRGVATDKLDALFKELDDTLVPKVVKVERLTPTIVEVVVKGKYIAKKFEPGQFYRLQNFETYAKTLDGTRLTMEGMALTGAWVDKEKELLSMIVLEMGASTRLCSILEPGDPVVVMGPTGAPSEIPVGKNVLLAGGGLGNAVLLSISRALRAAGSKVIYFAGYKNGSDIFKQREIEEGTDQVIWAVDRGEAIKANRPQDVSFVGNIVQAMVAYAEGKLQSPPLFDLKKIDHILAIGSDRMMWAVGQARHGVLKPYLNPDHEAIGSINSPMQCMMKEVCAQCLQKHVDPVTKKETIVFSCFNQDQKLDHVDWTNLNERLKMNSLAEKLTNRYLDFLYGKAKMERI